MPSNDTVGVLANEVLDKMATGAFIGMDWGAPDGDSTVFAECRYVVERRVHRWRGRKFCTNFRGLRYQRIWEWRTNAAMQEVPRGHD